MAIHVTYHDFDCGVSKLRRFYPQYSPLSKNLMDLSRNYLSYILEVCANKH